MMQAFFTRWSLELQLAAFMVILLVVICVGVPYMSQKDCQSKAELMGLPWKWSIHTSCMIRPPSGWVPMESYRVYRE